MNKVIIRPLEIKDAEVSWYWRNNPKIWELTGSKPKQEITYEIEKDWIEKDLVDPSTRRFAILVDEVYVGNIQLTDIIENETAQYHIFIGDTDFWGKGVAKLATFQILYFAKEVLKLSNVYLKVRKENVSAINVYSKNGFVTLSEENDWLTMICNLSEMLKPTVSVFVMVYNHEPFLKECLDGLLMQKCNFNFDIVVGEDCSNDKSREILLDYQKRYPGKFKLLLHKKNIGAVQNQSKVFENCKGKYIAMCEGDDYWTDPLKLQKQVDFLEENLDYGLVHTDFDAYHQSSGKFEYISKCENLNDSCFKDLLAGNYSIGTLTTCFRIELLREYLREINPVEKSWDMGDLPMWLYFSQKSKFYYINEITSVYRRLEESSFHSRDVNKILKFEESIFEVKIYFLNSYLKNKFFMSRKIKSNHAYSKMLINIKYKGSMSQFLVFSAEFYKNNHSVRFFLGSVKQFLKKIKALSIEM